MSINYDSDDNKTPLAAALSPLGFSPAPSQVEDYPFYQFSNNGNQDLYAIPEADEEDNVGTGFDAQQDQGDNKKMGWDAPKQDAQQVTPTGLHFSPNPKFYIDLMTRIMDLQSVNESEDYEQKAASSFITSAAPALLNSGNFSNEELLVSNFPYLKLHKELCKCISGYFNVIVEDEDFKTEFVKLVDQTKILKDLTKPGKYQDTGNINDVKNNVKSIADVLYGIIKKKCYAKMTTIPDVAQPLREENVWDQTLTTCILPKKLNLFIKKTKLNNKKNAYLQLIKYMNNPLNKQKVEDDVASTTPTILGVDSQHSKDDENISPFYPVLLIQENINNALLNKFQEKLANITINFVEDKVINQIFAYFERNNIKIKVSIKNLYGTTEHPPGINEVTKQSIGDAVVTEEVGFKESPVLDTKEHKPEEEAYDKEALDMDAQARVGFYQKQQNPVSATADQSGSPESDQPVSGAIVGELPESKSSGLKSNRDLTWDIYVKVKELSDLADLTHDTEQFFLYLDYINSVYSELPVEFKRDYFPIDKINKVFPVGTNKANQLKLRKFRLDLNEAFIKFLNDKNIPFQNPSTEDLTEAQGYYKLIGSIGTHGEGFIYVEAGRAPSVFKMQKYLENLSEDEKNEFINECNNYLGTDHSDLINNILRSNKDQISKLDKDIMVDKQLITNYDGAGCSKGYETNCSSCKFDYVFGQYTYHVYSVNPEPSHTLSPTYHLVKVTLTNDPHNVIQALFGFKGNVTINMLLLKAGGFKLNRGGEGGKGEPWKLNEIIDIYNKNCGTNEEIKINVTIKRDEILPGVSEECYYFNDGLLDPVKQLLWFGNKTAGDFVIGCYKTVKDGYTGDSGVAPSNILIFCGPTDGYADDTLPNIFRSTPGKGWVFTEGVTNPDITHQTYTFFQNYISIYQLATAKADWEKENAKADWEKPSWPYRLEDKSKDPKDLDEHLTRFKMLIRYVWDEFPKIINYTIKDENTYNRCFEQLFIAENYVMKQIIENYIKAGLEIINDFNTNHNLQTFVTKIMTLPKIPNLFLSKMNVEAINNQDSTSDIEDLLSDYPPNPLKSIIITNITNEEIKFQYYSDNFPSESLNSPGMTVLVQKPRFSTPNYITIPNYTIETLIYLFPFVQDKASVVIHQTGNSDSNEMEVEQNREDLKDNIKTRIVNYFNTLIENLNIDNQDLKTALNANIAKILQEGFIFDANNDKEQILDEKVTDPIFEDESQVDIYCPIDYAPAEQEDEMIAEAQEVINPQSPADAEEEMIAVQEVINQQSPAVQEGEMNAEVQGVNNQQPPAVQEGEMVAEVQGVINPQSPAGYGHQQQQFGIHELPPGGPIDVVQVNQGQVNQGQANRGKRKRQTAVTQDTPRHMRSTASSRAKLNKQQPNKQQSKKQKTSWKGGKRITKKFQKKSNKKNTKKYRKSIKSNKKKSKKHKKQRKILYTRRKR